MSRTSRMRADVSKRAAATQREVRDGMILPVRLRRADDLRFEAELREDEQHLLHYERTGEWLSPRPFPTYKR